MCCPGVCQPQAAQQEHDGQKGIGKLIIQSCLQSKDTGHVLMQKPALYKVLKKYTGVEVELLY